MLVVLPMPLPLRVTAVGLLLALLVTIRVPVRVPGAVGWNVTVTAQEPPAAMLVQLLVWLKSPVTATFETVAEVVPELVTVTACAAAVEPTSGRAKDRPARPALTESPPVRVPAAVGANFTLTVHEPFAAIDDPQVLVWVKSPLTEIDETDAAELVGLETVTVWAALVAPVATEPKLSALGVAVTPEAG